MPPPRASLPLFLTFTSGYFLSYFLRSANAVLAPDLRADVGLGPADLGFMTALFFGAYAAAQIPVGIALDRWGPRGVAVSLMSLGVAGALIFAVGESLASLALGRVLLGVGTGSVLLAGLKAFALWWPSHRFATISGIYFAAGSLGALLASAPLAWANEAIGWRAIFVLAAVLVALVTLLIYLRAPAVARARAESPAVADAAAPEFDGRTILALAAIMFLGAAHTGPVLAFQTLWGGPYLFDGYASDAATTGRYLLLLSLGVSFGYASSGALADRFGLRRVTITAALLFTLTQLALAAVVPGVTPLPWLLPLYALLGVTGGYCVLVLANARALLGVARSGRATGVVNAGSIGGVFALQWAIGVVVEAVGSPLGYRVALLGTGALTLLALLAFVVATRRRHRPATSRRVT
jgi:MFS family permease